MTKQSLPPIDLKEDVEKFKAFSEKTEISFNKCTHKQVKYTDGSLQCTCGVGFTGPRLDELYKLLTGE